MLYSDVWKWLFAPPPPPIPEGFWVNFGQHEEGALLVFNLKVLYYTILSLRRECVVYGEEKNDKKCSWFVAMHCEFLLYTK